VIVMVGLLAALVWIAAAARSGYALGQLVPVAVALLVMVLTRAAADVNRLSLHDFYRWRLSDGYAVTRRAVTAAGPGDRARFLAEAARTRLSALRRDGQPGGQPGPELVITTTANINANREVPPGRGGFCLAFDPDQVVLRGSPGPTGQARADTADYEHLVGLTRLTLFDLVAISGAAFSPLMGAATRGAYRILLTATNLRLGVWLPHPQVVGKARAYLNGQYGEGGADRWWARQTWLLLLWYVLPHPRWDRHREAAETREARLWAHVLSAREASEASEASASGNRAARLSAALCWRVMQPTFGMLWAEAAGHTSYRATWINVTDGGHYDNLGLVEALERGATNILVLDASGDRSDTWFTLGGSMALARTDAGVDIDLDPSGMVRGAAGAGPAAGAGLAPGAGPAPALGHGEVARPWARGTFTRPRSADKSTGKPLAGHIWVCKLGWWQRAPWDIRAYAAGHPNYPGESTLQQLYDGAEFDAYHELGACAVSAAAAEGQLPLGPYLGSRDRERRTGTP
jgi:hypothetical protein